MQRLNRRNCAKSFLRGFARALDLRGAVPPSYQSRRIVRRSDRAAIASDWAAVWSDLGNAFSRVVERDIAEAHG
jgi:hypothetical protein